MKKRIPLLLALAMIVSLCACGKTAAPPEAATPAVEASDDAAEAAAAEAAEQLLAEQLKSEAIPEALQGVWCDGATDGILSFYMFAGDKISVGVVNLGEGAAETFTGSFTVEDDKIRYQFNGASAYSQYTYEGDALTLTNANGMPIEKQLAPDILTLLESERASANYAGVVYLADLILGAYPDSAEANAAAEKEAEAEAAITAAGEAALAALKTTYDKVQQITWYEAKSQPEYVDIDCYIYPYIGRLDSGNTWLRIQLNYTDAKTDAGWIFFNTVIFCIDGENTTQSFSRNDIIRDNDTEVWETADYEAGAADISLLREIAGSTETIIRFQGDEYYADHIVTDTEKTAIADVLTAYNYLSNLSE